MRRTDRGRIPPAPNTRRRSEPRLSSLGLMTPDGNALPEVSQALTALLTAREITRETLAATEVSPERTEHSSERPDTSTWYAAALTTTAQAAWLLRDIAKSPAKFQPQCEVASAWQPRANEERMGAKGLDRSCPARTVGPGPTTANHRQGAGRKSMSCVPSLRIAARQREAYWQQQRLFDRDGFHLGFYYRSLWKLEINPHKTDKPRKKGGRPPLFEPAKLRRDGDAGGFGVTGYEAASLSGTDVRDGSGGGVYSPNDAKCAADMFAQGADPRVTPIERLLAKQCVDNTLPEPARKLPGCHGRTNCSASPNMCKPSWTGTPRRIRRQ
ncbi:hypothetical protein FQR65_LT20943 [Abscondita terminalis]|nr:hypothetical protein FQR65_LT20943 [Abscondita terminalis]